MRIFKRFLFCQFFICLLVQGSSAAPAQTDQREVWRSALHLYRTGSAHQAIPLLEEIVATGASPYESVARLLLCRSYFQQEDLGSARAAAQELISTFPHGRYAPYAHDLLAQIAFIEQNFGACAFQLLCAAQTAQDEELKRRTLNEFEAVFLRKLDSEQQDILLGWVQNDVLEDKLRAVLRGEAPTYRIGVILPLSGTQREASQRVLNGIKSALQAVKKKSAINLNLIIRDSGGEVIGAIKAARSLIEEEGVVALIGDLNGDCSAALAAVASAHRVPLIIPTAPDVGLAELGDAIFQLSADYYWEGSVAAAVTKTDLKAQDAAVLAPVSAAGTQRAKGFQDRFEAQGGKVVAVQWYWQDASTFQRQLDALEKAANKRLRETAKTSYLPNTSAFDEPSSREASESPLNVYDALYLPIEGEELTLLLTQIAERGYSGWLIGDAACLELVALKANSRKADGMVFPAHFASPTQFANSDILREYRAITGESPDRWAVQGWDACQFLVSALHEVNYADPAQIREWLQAIRSFAGIRLKLAFSDSARVNRALYVLKFENHQFQIIKTPEQVILENFK